LAQLEPTTKIYLAVPQSAYDEFFSGEGMQFIIKQEDVSMFVVDLQNEEIVKWIN
jgi:hypothetical protein